MIATTSSRCSPIATSSSANTPVQRRPPLDSGWPVFGSKAPGTVHLVGLVVLGRAVAVALAGDAVHHDRAVELAGLAQGGLEGGEVVAVDRADVLQAEVLEHPLRGEQVLHAALHAVQRLVQRRADDRHPRQVRLDAAEHPLVAGPQPQAGEALGQADRWSGRRSGRCR